MEENKRITMDDIDAFTKKRLRVPVEPVPEMAPVIMRAMEHIKALALEHDESAIVTLEPEMAYIDGGAAIVCVCDTFGAGNLLAFREATREATSFDVLPRTDGRISIAWRFKGVFTPAKKD